MEKNLSLSRSNSILLTVAAYLAALCCAILVVRATSLQHPLAQLALGDLVATVVIFLFSVALNNSSMYDPYWSLKPLVFAVYYLMFPSLAGEGVLMGSWRLLLVTTLILLYSIRLTSNFYRDWPGLKHEDWRYQEFRKQYPKIYWLMSFFGIHFFPTVMVYLGCLPLFGIWQAGQTPFNLTDLAGGLILTGAIILAFTADEQLRRFRKNPANKGMAITTGLWGISRHPNYLGEILTWWGLFLVGLAAGIGYWWTGIGAVMITLMFLFISIPMIEKRNLQRRKGYTDYIERVPELVPKLL
ncbi:MAG: DUF1295 domain-containing protein [Bacteroidales bacterium]|nr:DUF1295 domain-containing protein [Bacteroidales bacterium]